MYGLPPEVSPAFLVGNVIEQVCFTQNTLTISFSGDILLTIESALMYKSASDANEAYETIPARSSGVLQIVGCRVRSAFKEDERHLVILFEDGQQLAIRDDSKLYESY